LDYIFILNNNYFRHNGCSIEQVIDLKDIRIDPHVGFPNDCYPSNHFLIGYRVRLQKYASSVGKIILDNTPTR